MMQNKLARLPTRLNYIQSIEVFGDFVSAKLHFEKHHEFHTLYDPDLNDLRIFAEVPDDFDWRDLDPEVRGSAQLFAFRPEFGRFKISGLSHEATFDEIASGTVSFFPVGEDPEYSFSVHPLPDDPNYVERISRETLDIDNVRAAFDRLTKSFFEED